MRNFELALLVLVTIAVIWALGTGGKNKKKELFLLGAATAVFIAHAFLEGLRIQLVCVYLAIPPLYLNLLLSKHPNKGKKRIALALLACLCLGGTLLALWLFPVNKMPTPKGPYAIGTDTYELVEPDRKELYGPKPGTDRHIKFQIWYPADSPKGGKLTNWLTGGKKEASGIPAMFKLPHFLLDHTSLVKAHSYTGLPISNKETSYPLILISHGWTGFSSLHSDLAEMLASEGYLVASINHTYGAAVSVFDDGEVAYVDPYALPDKSTVDDFERYSQALVKTFSDDDQAVLDFLESDRFFGEKIKKDAIGALGHSTGGGGVVKLAITDPRIQAVLGLDAWVEPIEKNILQQGLHIPNAFLRSEQWETGPNNTYLKELFENTTAKPAIYQVEGGNHQDFSMLYMYLPITKVLGVTGRLDPLKNAEVQQSFVLTFFDHTLKNKPKDLQDWFRNHVAVTKVEDFN
jgi:predicted dienelactone hydrolase